MVNKVFRLLNRDFNGLHEAAFLLAISSFASRLLALFRDRLFASKFGAGEVLDIYYASFRIPDVVYALIASLVAATVLIPFILERLDGKKGDLKVFINSILTFFSVLIILVSLLFFFAMPALSKLIVPGFDEAARDTFILLSRILLLSPVFLGLSNLFGSINQAFRKFFVYALSPVLYNLGIIAGIVFLYEPFGMKGLAYGVVLGALMHFAIQIPFVFRAGIFPRLTLNINFNEIKTVLILSLPRTVTLSIHHIIVLVFVSLASFLNEGSIAIFNLSYNLQSVPLAIIGVSYSVAAFPTLSKLYLDGKKELFVRQVAMAGRHIIFWSLPALSLFIVLRAQIVRVILGAGKFSWTDTRLTAAALALFSFSVAAQGLILLFVRSYYAAGNTKKPLFVNVASSIVSVVAVFLFLHLFDTSQGFRGFFETMLRVDGIEGTKVLMLPLAFSLGAIINMLFLWLMFMKDFKEFYVPVRNNVYQAIAGSIVMGVVTYLLLQVLSNYFELKTFLEIFLQGFLAGIGGLSVGVLFLKMLRNKEIKEFEESLQRKFWKRKPLAESVEGM